MTPAPPSILAWTRAADQAGACELRADAASRPGVAVATRARRGEDGPCRGRRCRERSPPPAPAGASGARNCPCATANTAPETQTSAVTGRHSRRSIRTRTARS